MLDYLSTFPSLILGLGVANILAQFSRLVKFRRVVQWYWVHTLWGIFFLLAMASEWWILQQWRGVTSISYFVYLTFLIKPAILFFASDLLFPETDAPTALDLHAHFFGVHRAVFLVSALYPVADVVDTLLKGWDHFVSLGATYPVVMTILLAGNVAGAFSRSPRYHAVYVVVVYAAMLFGVATVLFAV